MLVTKRNQHGMTLIEVMVAITLSLIVLGAVIAVYLMTLKTSGATVGSGRLNQDALAIMSIMTSDIRRAGYANPAGEDWDGNGTDNYREPATNPFSQRNSTALEVHTYDGTNDVNKKMQGKGDCIVFAYDAENRDGVLDDKESFGFRLNAARDTVQMRQSIDSAGGEKTNSCADGEWQGLNEPSDIVITKLEFDLAGSSCINALEPDGKDNDGANGFDDLREADCYANNPDPDPVTGSGDNKIRNSYPGGAPVPVVERRHVLITLEAALKNEPNVKTVLTQQVVVRNDLARLIP